jgi:hypothetical protein
MRKAKHPWDEVLRGMRLAALWHLGLFLERIHLG